MTSNELVIGVEAVRALWKKIKDRCEIPLKAITKGEWDSLDSIQKNASIVYLVIDGEGKLSVIYKNTIICSNFEESHENVYSNEEILIGRWINEKPLYRIVINSTLPSSSSDSVIANIEHLKIDTLVKMRCFFYYKSASIFIGDLELSTSPRPIIRIMSVENKTITSIVQHTNYQNAPCEIILEYTKTTDDVTIQNKSRESGDDHKTFPIPVTALVI